MTKEGLWGDDTGGLWGDYGGYGGMTMEGYGEFTGGIWGINWRAMGMTMEGDDYGGLREDDF